MFQIEVKDLQEFINDNNKWEVGEQTQDNTNITELLLGFLLRNGKTEILGFLRQVYVSNADDCFSILVATLQ